MESDKSEIVIGQKIKEVFDSSGMKIGDFAEKLGMVRQNVYRIFERTHIDTSLLIKISQLLDHNFFQYYTKLIVLEAPAVNQVQPTNSATVPTASAYNEVVNELSKTRIELELANKEIMYLKKIIDLMEERTRWIGTKS